MKIAFVSLMNGVPWGGSEELWYRTAKLALSLGHQIITVTRQWKETPVKIEELKRLGSDSRFYFQPVYNLFDRVAFKLRLKSYQSVYIPSIDTDVFIISNGSTFDFLYNKELCDYIIGTGKPYVIISQHNFENGGLVEGGSRDYSLAILNGAEKSFFVSERNLHTAERQLAHTINKAEVISNPINIKNRVIKAFPESESLLMACVARLDCNFKGQDILLQVLSSENWKNRNFHLKLYGSGPHELHLKQLIHFYRLENKVTIEGHTQNVDSIWEQNQVLVLPSLSEGTPLALIEAMFSGRAVVATDVGDSGKYVLNGCTGFLAPTASVLCLTESLEGLWENKHRLKEFGANAFQQALKITNLHPEKCLLRFVENIH